MARDVVVIGASLGGIEAVSELLRGLPEGFPASVFVVIHQFGSQPSALAAILDRAGALPAVYPRNLEVYRPGLVYVAPPDLHLLIEKEHIRLARSPKENMHRPAIDPLFRTAAFYGRRRVVGVLLTGADSDGTAGLFSVKLKGGLTVVQDPEEAQAQIMPFSAITNVKVDHVLPVKEIARLLMRVVGCRERGVRG